MPARTVALDQDFETVTGRHRRELHVHCYRMLASYDEAEGCVQETFLHHSAEGSGSQGLSRRVRAEVTPR